MRRVQNLPICDEAAWNAFEEKVATIDPCSLDELQERLRSYYGISNLVVVPYDSLVPDAVDIRCRVETSDGREVYIAWEGVADELP